MKVSGIYQITNTQTGKCYVGSSKSIYRRWNDHLSKLRRGKHNSPHLQLSYNKYGRKCFVMKILASCPEEYLLKMEQWFLDSQKPEYNINPTAGNSLNVKHTEATKLKISSSLKGRIPSEEVREKRAAATRLCIQSGKRKNNGRGKSARYRNISQYDMDNNHVKDWTSTKEIYETLGFHRGRLLMCCRGTVKSCGGYLWKLNN